MKVVFIVEVQGVENWHLTEEQKRSSSYWKEIKEDIKEALDCQFGKENISITIKLEA